MPDLPWAVVLLGVGLLLALVLASRWETPVRSRVLAAGRSRPLGVTVVLVVLFGGLGAVLTVLAALLVGPAAGSAYDAPSGAARAVLWVWSVLHLGVALTFSPTTWQLPSPTRDTVDLRVLGADRATALTTLWVGFALTAATLLAVVLVSLAAWRV